MTKVTSGVSRSCVSISGSTGSEDFNPLKTYSYGNVVTWTSPVNQVTNKYIAKKESPAGTLPSDTNTWTAFCIAPTAEELEQQRAEAAAEDAAEDALIAEEAPKIAAATLWNETTEYAVGDFVLYYTGIGDNTTAYKLHSAAPAGTLPNNGTFWKKPITKKKGRGESGAESGAVITSGTPYVMDPRCPMDKTGIPDKFDPLKTYAINDLVSWNPYTIPGSSEDPDYIPNIYKLVEEVPAGTLPLNAKVWKFACLVASLSKADRADWDSKVKANQAAKIAAEEAAEEAAEKIKRDAATPFDLSKQYSVGDYVKWFSPELNQTNIYKLRKAADAGTLPSRSNMWARNPAPVVRSSGAILKEKMDILQANITKTTTNAQAVANVAKTIGGRRKSKRKAARKTKRKAKKTRGRR